LVGIIYLLLQHWQIPNVRKPELCSLQLDCTTTEQQSVILVTHGRLGNKTNHHLPSTDPKCLVWYSACAVQKKKVKKLLQQPEASSWLQCCQIAISSISFYFSQSLSIGGRGTIWPK
jgi:hypothetical protein